MEPIEKKTRLIVALVTACALMFSGLFSLWPETLGFTQTAAALGYESAFDSASLMRVDITAYENDWQSMLDNAMNEEWIECDIALNGEIITSAGIRCKGNSSLSMTEDERYSFKISFGEYVKNQTFHGLDKMVLNNTQSDNTFIKEYLSYYLMNKAGVSTPLFSMAEIYVNGTYWGLYLAVECIDDSFIERNFSTDGGFLYKPDGTAMGNMGNFENFDFSEMKEQLDSMFSGDGTFPAMDGSAENDGMTMPDMGTFPAMDGSAENGGMTMPDMGNFPTMDGSAENGGMTMPDMGDFTMPSMGGDSQSAAALGYLGDDIDLYADIFDYAKTNTPSDADKSRLIAALKALSEGDLDSSLNVSDAIGWLAVNALLVNDDGYLGSMLHNYYLYELNGVLTLLPWDYNLAFGGFAGGSATSAVNDPIDTPASSERPLVTTLLSDEETLEAYHEVLSELATFLTDGSMDQLITELAAMIDTSVQNDPTKECTYEEFLTGIETLRSFCTLRGESILGQLDGSIPSTEEGQSADSSALIQADFNLSDMGSQGGGKGGFGGERMNKQAEFSRHSGEERMPADSQASSSLPTLPDGDLSSAQPMSPDGDKTTESDSALSTDDEQNSSDSTSDSNRAFEKMLSQRMGNGTPFASENPSQNGTSFVYSLALDLAAALALIVSLLLITRRRR